MSYFDSIYADTLLPPRAVSVYMYLKDRSNSAGSCWPGIKTIARDMNLSRSTVKRALADLATLPSCLGIVQMGATHPIFTHFYEQKWLVSKYDTNHFTKVKHICCRPPRDNYAHLLNPGWVHSEPTGTDHSIGD